MDKRYNYPLRVDKKLVEKARYVANYQGRSLNKQIEQLLIRMVQSHETKYGAIETSLDDEE